MPECEIQIRILPHYEGLPLPQYMTEGSSGFDLLAAVTNPVELAPQSRCVIPTGIQVSIPEGFEGQVRPRSGLALRDGILLPNSPGTIDSDYRGEIQVIFLNSASKPFLIERGMRIAQLVITPVVKARFVLADNLDATVRGAGGFGHTGR